jgi:hypothetical protein
MLRVYTHLVPSSEGRTRKAIDDLFGIPSPPGDEISARDAPETPRRAGEE